jgi:hypothetical protein
MSEYWEMANGEIIRAGEHEPCSVPGCPNGKCYRLDSDKCWPHSHGLEPALMNQLHGIVDATEPVKETCE